MIHQFPLPPSSNKYWRMVKGRMLVSADAKNYKITLAMLARCARVTQLTGPVAVTVNVYRERKAGDLDNFLKVLIDALEGVFFQNDSQVRVIHATLGDDKHNPRVEISVISLLSL